jgi:alkanesulfonate monooxygenase SsuD/methylene tetrahydromethanopterin reductase-like flavin-dependent oxidoreductase (luciferase family)
VIDLARSATRCCVVRLCALGTPVIVQAGSSEDAKHLAAKHADLNFSLVRTIEEGERYREDLDERLQRSGRGPSDLKVLPGILPTVARSRTEAEERRDFLETLVPARVGIDLVSSWCGMDLSAYPIASMAHFRRCPTYRPTMVRGQIWKGSRLFAKENLTIARSLGVSRTRGRAL